MTSVAHYGINYRTVLYTIDQTHQILPYLYLSGMKGFRDIDKLKRLGVTLVVSVCPTEEIWNKPLRDANIKHAMFPVYDNSDDQDLIMEAAKESHEAIEKEAANNGIVLLCCSAGISRSITVAIYHMMQADASLSPSTALQKIRAVRCIAEPNEWFMMKLNQYHANRNSSK
jgi:protein-tyrosine phosphatase